MSLDEIIKELKRQKKYKELSNTELAEEMEVHKNTVSRVINGGNCMLYVFLDLVDALGMELELKEKEEKE